MLEKLKQLQPKLFVLIEPYSDHVCPDLLQRFKNAWFHYGLTFQAIDQVEASQEEKQMVKAIFFGREIQDVLGHNENRAEQMETAEMWLTKLKTVGFRPQPVSLDGLQVGHLPPQITMTHHSDYVGLNVDRNPIVAVIAVQ